MNAPRKNLDVVILAVQSLAEPNGSSVNSVYKYLDSASTPVKSKHISAMTKNDVAMALIRGVKRGLLSPKYGRFMCSDSDVVQQYRKAKSEVDRKETRRQRRKSQRRRPGHHRKQHVHHSRSKPHLSSKVYGVPRSKAGRKKK